MAYRRKDGRRIPLGHKPRGRQRVDRVPIRNGPTAQQSVVGTRTSTPPGVFSSAAGGAGYRTLQPPPLARAPVQPSSLGFFTPFGVSNGPGVRTRAQVPFASTAPASPQVSSVMPPTPFAPKAPATSLRSTIFAPPR